MKKQQRKTGNTIDISDLWVGTTKTSESYVGYYADVNGDGFPDGIICVDLAVDPSALSWYGFSSSYSSISNAKNYLVSEEDYEGIFGTNKVISCSSSSQGSERFYVMALSDFSDGETSKFWYYYNWTSSTIPDTSEFSDGSFGMGASLTKKMLSYWTEQKLASQSSNDVWWYIQDEVDSGWFIPSSGELASALCELGVILNITYSSSGQSRDRSR